MEDYLKQLQDALSIAKKLSISCEPIFKHFPIKTFGYIRIFNDGRISHLSTNTEWLMHCYKNSLYDDENYLTHLVGLIQTDKPQYFLRFGKPEGAIQKSLHDFDLWNSVVIGYRSLDYLELFGFMSSKDLTRVDPNFYLHRLDLLKEFISYLKNKFFVNINSDRNLPFLNTPKLTANSEKVLSCFRTNIYNDEVKEFLKEIETKRYYISADDSIYITKRQLHCVHLLSQGKSAKEIGLALNISYRTVEKILEVMRIKLECHTKTELISKISKINL